MMFVEMSYFAYHTTLFIATLCAPTKDIQFAVLLSNAILVKLIWRIFVIHAYIQLPHLTILLLFIEIFEVAQLATSLQYKYIQLAFQECWPFA